MKQSKVNNPTPRRGFIEMLAAGAAAIGLSTIVNPVKAHAENAMAVASGDELDAWFGSMKGKYKMVFDAPHPHKIFPFAWPKVFLMSNGMAGASPDDCSALVVLRHDAICYAMEDRMWEKYKLGEFFNAPDPLTSKPALRNPFWQPKPGDFKVPGIGEVQIGINELQTAGVKFCVCSMALTVNSSAYAAKNNMDANVVLEDWKSGILPGVKQVPSGVMAIGRAQDNGCGYCFTG